MRACLLSLVLWAFPCVADLSFEVPVNQWVPEMEGYLTQPGALAVAFENSGQRISWSGHVSAPSLKRVELHRERPFPFKTAALEFQRRAGNIFFYKAEVDWNMGVATKMIPFQVEIDISNRTQGVMSLRIKSKWLSLLPDSFSVYINERLRSFLSPEKEVRLVQYLKKAQLRSPKAQLAQSVIFQDAFNALSRSPAVQQIGHFGNAEQVSNQLFVIISMVVWGLGVPIFFAFRWKKLQRVNASRK